MTEPAAVAEATPDTAPQPADAAEPAGEDRPTVEVMPPAQPAQPPAVVEKSALEHAAEELMATPGAPGRDEFLVLATTARILSMSAGAPKAVRANPWLAFHLALIGRDLGISPSAALQQIDVIGEGDDAQLSLSPELLNGQIRRLGLGSIVPGERTDLSCEAVALTPDRERLGSTTFTWAEAVQAGLVDQRCQPFDHWEREGVAEKDAWKKENRCRCRQGWRTYPKRMLWWRSAGYAASDYFPEAGLGLYSPEELGAVVDPTTGRPYDPATVELPEGYEEPERPHDPGDDLLAEAEEGSDLHQGRRELLARIDAIKAAGEAPVAALRELWEQEDEEGHRRTPPLPHLRRRHLVRARAVVKSVEDRIKKGDRDGGFGVEAKEAWVHASADGAGFGQGKAPDAQDSPGDATAADDAGGSGDAPGASERALSEQEAREARAVAEYEAAAAESSEARMLRAVGVMIELGRPVSDDDLLAYTVDEVKAMEPTDVLAALAERSVEPKGNPQNHRKQLAEAIYTERRAALPAPDPEG